MRGCKRNHEEFSQPLPKSNNDVEKERMLGDRREWKASKNSSDETLQDNQIRLRLEDSQTPLRGLPGMGLLEWDFVHFELWLRLVKIISGVMALVADPETPSAGLRETDTSHIPFAARGCRVHGVPSSPQIHEKRKQNHLKMRSIK